MITTVPISVIIPSHVRLDPLLKTLAIIQQCDPAPAEILVHIDGGCERIREALTLAHPDVRLLSSDLLLGPGGSRNKLLHAASHELVANFDDDSFPEKPDYFTRVLELAKLFPEAAILSAANHDEKPWSTRFAQLPAASGCGCIFRKSWFLKVGEFVPLPIAYNMEEVDMGLRLHALGGIIVRDAELTVIHDKPQPILMTREVNACFLANTALFPFLRFPVWLWPVGLWQVLHRVLYLIHQGWTDGIPEGLRMIPSHLHHYSAWKNKVRGSHILSWLVLRRFPKSLTPKVPNPD